MKKEEFSKLVSSIKEAVEIKEGTAKKEKSREKLGFNETRELKALPAEIEQLEAEQEELYALMAEPDFYKDAGAADAKARSEEIIKRLEEAYARWEELEELSG